MTIASEKVKLASERFLLVRITPGRFIDPPLISGTTYGEDFPYPIARIERNGTALTKVSSLSGNDQYTYDESTLELRVRLASAPNDTTNILIVYYYLFYTGTVFRSISEDPEDDATTTREWQPRLLNYPVVGQSFTNIINGVFTISDTQIEIINTDHSFQDYLTDDDSFYNKTVEIWMCINSVDNIQKIFTGTINEISATQNTIFINAADSFNRLKQAALMGDSEDETTFNLTEFPNLNPSDIDIPIPYIVGPTSRYQTQTVAGLPAGSPTCYQVTAGTKAVCTNFNPTISTSVNRNWGMCRLKAQNATQAFGTLQAVANPTAGLIFARFSSLSNIKVGDTIRWTEGGTNYGLIKHVGDFTYSSVTYNIAFQYDSALYTGGFTLLGATVINSHSFAIIIDAPSETLSFLQPLTGRDYGLLQSSTSGGNFYVSLVFSTNFESFFTGYTALNPNSHTVSFRATNDTIHTHADILQDMVEAAGLTINSTSFSDMNTASDVNAMFHIPNFDETGFDTYLKYCEDVLSSTLGYLWINSDFEVEYNLLSAPSSTSARDNFLTIDGETRASINYQDIATQIVAYNPHNSSIDVVISTPSPSQSESYTKSKYLHDLINVNRLRHSLEVFDDFIDKHINLKSKRQVIYDFATATEDIDSDLGADLQLENSIVLGGSEISDVKITSIEKSPSKVSIKASDLKGL